MPVSLLRFWYLLLKRKRSAQNLYSFTPTPQADSSQRCLFVYLLQLFAAQRNPCVARWHKLFRVASALSQADLLICSSTSTVVVSATNSISGLRLARIIDLKAGRRSTGHAFCHGSQLSGWHQNAVELCTWVWCVRKTPNRRHQNYTCPSLFWCPADSSVKNGLKIQHWWRRDWS